MDTLKNVQEVHHCLSDIDSEAHIWMYNLTTNPIWQQSCKKTQLFNCLSMPQLWKCPLKEVTLARELAKSVNYFNQPLKFNMCLLAPCLFNIVVCCICEITVSLCYHLLFCFIILSPSSTCNTDATCLLVVQSLLSNPNR